MSTIKKHVGKVKSSDQRCVVVFMQLPDDPEKALIISTESLPPRYEQMLLDVVDSQEAQAEKDLASAMARRTVAETGRTVLAEFHARGMMRTEPIDNIVMMPRPNTPFPLREILEQMGTLSTKDQLVENNDAEVKYNPITANQQAGKTEERLAMARNLLMEAEMLQAEANKKREAAFKYAPSLRPGVQASSPSLAAVTPQAAPTALPEGLVLTETGELKKAGAGRPTKAQLAAINAHNARLSLGGNV